LAYGRETVRPIFARSTASHFAEGYVLLTVILGLLAGALSLLFLNTKPVSAVTPSGFTDQLVASVNRATALAFTPDGRLLVANQNGKLLVYEDGVLRTIPALDISAKVCSGVGERGLVGVAVDPNFAANRYIYVYYTFKKHGVCEQNTANVPVNRVERYVLSDASVATPDKILVDNVPHLFIHNGGDLHFGKDGYLYVTVGDGGCDYAGDFGCNGENDASRDPHTLLGKVLRITRDGDVPATNPYTGADSARCNLTGMTNPGKKCQETFASGLRNPFRFAFDPNASGTRFFINDVGEARWEEVNLGEKGADYAWNLCEGNHDNPNMPGSVNCAAAPYTPPVHEYAHDTGCSSITGAAFVPNGVWPAAYDNSYLYSDYVCGKVFRLKPDGAGGFTRTDFVTGLGERSAVAMTFGPHGSGQALYYITFGNGGEVRRIAYTGGVNRPPTAAVAASPTSGSLPLRVGFDGSGSGDPDAGGTLSYLWNFGDGSAAQTTTAATVSHAYSVKGTYTASLRVRDNHGALSDPATVRIDAGNRAPNPAIGSPSADLLYRVGQQITLSGSASDPEDGALPASSRQWEVLRHHNGSHSHLVYEGTGNNLTFAAPPPEGLFSTGAYNYLEVRLTATDSEGLSRTVTREIQPHRVNVTLGSTPSGLTLQVNGEAFVSPRTLVSWEGYKLSVSAPSPQTLSGISHVFSSWSDGKGQQHDITTGAAPSTYTATFKTCTQTGTPGDDVLDGTPNADVICGMSGNDTIRGLGGNDIVEGQGGNDALRGSGGADKVKGGTGNDTLYGEDGNDALDSKDGVSGNDSLDGGAGSDTKVTDATTERSVVGFP
jgi:glucose/arabinose dehydrogenase